MLWIFACVVDKSQMLRYVFVFNLWGRTLGYYMPPAVQRLHKISKLDLLMFCGSVLST